MNDIFKIFYGCLISCLVVASVGVHAKSDVDRSPVLLPMVIGQLDDIRAFQIK